MDKEEFEKIAKRMVSGKTQGSRKLLEYVRNIIQSDGFQNEVKKLRRHGNIPPNGFSYNLKSIITPNPPDKIDAKTKKSVEKLADKICKKYGLHIVDWSECLSSYIYYNKMTPPFDFQLGHLFQTTDLKAIQDDPFSKTVQHYDNTVFPIAIRISPYATKRDLLDYVAKAFPLIQYLQKQYRKPNIKIGKFRKRDKNIIKRNEFIFKNKKLPLKKLAEKLQDELNISLDEGHIAKIISIENQRRRKV